jgi:hypothetical protein
VVLVEKRSKTIAYRRVRRLSSKARMGRLADRRNERKQRMREIEMSQQQRVGLPGKTDAMFRRYAIVDERDLRDAVELLAKGTRGGQSEHYAPKVATG